MRGKLMIKNNQSNPFHCAPNKSRIEKGINPIKQGKAKVLNLDKFREKKRTSKQKQNLFLFLG